MPHCSAVIVTALLWLLVPHGAPAQSTIEDYRVERSHPRLLLTPRRTRLLRRERERKSVRWLQFEALMQGAARMPEPGFAEALYSIAGGGDAHAERAIEWALGEGRDLRQLALVYDWCYELISAADRRRLREKLLSGLGRLAADDSLPAVRSRTLAAAALGETDEGARELRWVIETWWRGKIIPGLRAGKRLLPRDQMYELMEILHVIDANLRIDLRRDYPQYFSALPAYLLLTYYPAVYPAAENEYYIPVVPGGGEPDLDVAARARAANLSMVAFDPNSLEVQYLQGWSMQDRFLMRGAYGITYEFLWANPYQPGLSYYNAPLSFYDETAGTLIVRSSWGGDAAWFYFEGGELQTFTDGRIRVLHWEDLDGPLRMGDTVVVPLHERLRFEVETTTKAAYYLIGLEAGATYDFEVDDEELYERTADGGGILKIEFPPGRHAGVRLRRYSGR